MSLATDILKAASRLPPVLKPKSPKFGPQLPPGVYTIRDMRLARPEVKFRAFSHKPDFTVIGDYPTASRASVAVRLYNLWLRQGYDDVPHKPSIKTYRRSELS